MVATTTIKYTTWVEGKTSMRLILTESKEGIGVGIPDKKWVFAPLKCWQESPFQELIRTFHLLGFELKIEKE